MNDIKIIETFRSLRMANIGKTAKVSCIWKKAGLSVANQGSCIRIQVNQ